MLTVTAATIRVLAKSYSYPKEAEALFDGFEHSTFIGRKTRNTFSEQSTTIESDARIIYNIKHQTPD